MSEVIEFPKERQGKFSTEEIYRRELEQSDYYYKQLEKFIRGITNDFYFDLTNDLKKANIETVSEQFNRDFAFIEDAIQALVYRSYGLEHHLHDQIDKSGIKFVPDLSEIKENNDDDPNPDPGPLYA